ncbi:MAG: hypothetical protein KZQ76_07875 [Candidatus Thiodiazotropha sp. (ex Epidulcina cf. delphinae)]|nr:hypothetical protein [Candidatus Thiodiazotropha sp. (ex Epidulcina cf. delphinae)]
MSKVRRFFISLTALTLGLMFSVLAAEGILRLLGTPTGDLYTVNERKFNEVPGIYEPGQEIVRTINRHLPHKVRINHLGYRGRDFPLKKPNGIVRILLVGDSYVFGEFVQENETLPAQLERLLQARCGGMQVINAGLLGGTIIGESRLVERGLELEPDLVVLVFHENDIEDLYSPLWLGLARNRAAKSRFPISLLYPLVRNTAIWNFAMQISGKLRAVRAAQAARDSTSDATEGAEASAHSYDSIDLRKRYENELRHLRDFLRVRDVAFTFVTYPGHNAVNGSERHSGSVQWAVDIATKLGISTINLLGRLRDSRDPGAAYLLPWDGHPSAKGHSVAATALVEHLLEQERPLPCTPVSAHFTPFNRGF